MKNDDKKFIVPRMLLALMVIFVVTYFISVIAGFTPFYNSTAAKNALVDVHEDAETADLLIAQRYQDLYDVKEEITDTSSHDAVSNVLRTYIGSETFGDLRFFSKGKIYDVNGLEVENEMAEIQAFSGLNHKACSGEYLDGVVNKSCIAFYIPIVGSEYIDGLASIVEARNFIDATSLLNERAKAVAIITKSGYNLGQSVREGFEYSIGNDYYRFIVTLTQNQETGNKVLLEIRKGEGVVHINVEGQPHTVAVKALPSSEGKLYVVSLSSSEDLMLVEMGYLRHTISLLVIAIISFTVSLVYAVLYHKNAKKQIKLVSYTYPNIDCPNLEQFKLDVINTMGTVPVTLKKYSVVAFKIGGYMSFTKNLGEEDADEIVKQAAKIFAGFCEYILEV
jgi:hypothetical protein